MTEIQFAYVVCALLVGYVGIKLILVFLEDIKPALQAYDFRSAEAAVTFYDQLSIQELEAIEALENIDKNSIWGIAVEQVIASHSVTRFRAMIADLKSQNADNALVMECILGDAYDKVMAL